VPPIILPRLKDYRYLIFRHSGIRRTMWNWTRFNTDI
jgi:hypothetical protein